MFTDALLDVLNGGDPSYPPELSLNDIRDLTWEKLGTKSEEPVRPALYLSGPIRRRYCGECCSVSKRLAQA